MSPGSRALGEDADALSRPARDEGECPNASGAKGAPVCNPEVSQRSSVPPSATEARKPRRSLRQYYKSLFFPSIVNLRSGVRRLVCIDILRGISIIGMCIAHGINRTAYSEWYLQLDTLQKKVVVAIQSPAIFFAAYRGIFSMCSGCVYSYLNSQSIERLVLSKKPFPRKAKRICAVYIASVLRAFVSYFVLQLFNAIGEYALAFMQSYATGGNIFTKHWYEVNPPRATAMTYFAYSSLIENILFFPVYLCVLLFCNATSREKVGRPAQASGGGEEGIQQSPFQSEAVSIKRVLQNDLVRANLINASIFYILGFAIAFLTPFVRQWCASSLGITEPEFNQLEFAWEYTDRQSFAEAQFYYTLAGRYMSLFPFYGSTCFGYVIGHILAISRLYQKALEDRVPNYTHSLTRYSDVVVLPHSFRVWVYSVLFAIVVPFALIGFPAAFYAGNFIVDPVTGKMDSNYLKLGEFILISGSQILLIILSIYTMEGRTAFACCRAAQKVSWVLKFSTLSLTFFVLQTFIYRIPSWWLQYYYPDLFHGREKNPYAFYGNLLYGAVVVVLALAALDSIECRFTLDWAVSRLGGLFSGKLLELRPLSDCHLNVWPSMLLVRPPKLPRDYAEIGLHTVPWRKVWEYERTGKLSPEVAGGPGKLSQSMDPFRKEMGYVMMHMGDCSGASGQGGLVGETVSESVNG